MPANELGLKSKKERVSNDLATTFVKWREIAADRNQRSA
jgi:hypothetical protein